MLPMGEKYANDPTSLLHFFFFLLKRHKLAFCFAFAMFEAHLVWNELA